VSLECTGDGHDGACSVGGWPSHGITGQAYGQRAHLHQSEIIAHSAELSWRIRLIQPTSVFSNLKPDIESALRGEPNESDTRLKVLDRFLFEVLEWKYEAVFTEPPTASGYIDYLLTIGERRGAMVIEAKRFGLLQPATKSDEVMYVSLSGPVVKPLLSGIKQAMNYALENGVSVAAVTDGNTIL